MPENAWACYAHLLPAPVATPCGAHGEADKDAEAHTKATGHPTTSGTVGGVRWALARSS